MKLAEEHSRTMAARDKVDHNVGKASKQRARGGSSDAKVAVENVSAGYHTLAEAFSGWRDSPPHRANMLNKQRDPHGHRGCLFAELEVQGVLDADPRGAGRQAGLTPNLMVRSVAQAARLEPWHNVISANLAILRDAAFGRSSG